MRIIIVDDDKIVSASLKIILEANPEIEVSGVGKNGKEAIELYEKECPDVVLMDIRMEEMSGLEAGEKIISRHPEAKILYLTTFLDDDYIVKALSIGAKGYMLKQNFERLQMSIQAVAAGQNVYGDEIVEKLPGLLKHKNSKKVFLEKGITEKEFGIVEKIADGLSNKEISEELFLGEGTIRNYIRQILEKLELKGQNSDCRILL
jgi:DNA-binding NarL/FixJ family response regulator